MTGKYLLIDEERDENRNLASLRIPADCKTLLVCEGRNDARFLTKLARDLKNPAVYGHWLGGRQKVKTDEGLAGVVNVPDIVESPSAGIPLPLAFLRLHSFAVILDADSDGKALKEINDALKAPFEIGADFKHGEVKPIRFRNFPGAKILAGAFVMPGFQRNGKIEGKLEDLVLKAARQKNKKEMECVDKFRKCAEDIGNKPKKKDEAKKQAQAFLCALPENKTYLGAAAQDGLIDFSAPAYSELKAFLQKLSP